MAIEDFYSDSEELKLQKAQTLFSECASLIVSKMRYSGYSWDYQIASDPSISGSITTSNVPQEKAEAFFDSIIEWTKNNPNEFEKLEQNTHYDADHTQRWLRERYKELSQEGSFWMPNSYNIGTLALAVAFVIYVSPKASISIEYPRGFDEINQVFQCSKRVGIKISDYGEKYSAFVNKYQEWDE